jgi:TATA-binding protein-associated factor Taf7
MKTKYGRDISNDSLVDYFAQLTNDIYKCLPLYEQVEYGQYSIYVETLLIELNSSRRMLFVNDVDFLKLLTNLEPLLILTEHKKLKRQVFKCTDICQKLLKKYREGLIEDGI